MRVRIQLTTPAEDISASNFAASGAVVRVFVQDTSRLDQAARPVAETTMTIDELAPRMPVEITCRDPAGNESLTVRVHVDSNASGGVTAGDLVSTQAHAAIDGEVEIPLTRVT